MNAIAHSNIVAFPGALSAIDATALCEAVAAVAIDDGDLDTIDADEIEACDPVEEIAPVETAPAAVGEFIVARADLQKAVAALVRVIERRNTIPILSNVRLLASGGVLILTATDLDLQVSAMVECKPGEFHGTIAGHVLHDILRKGAASDEVGFRAWADGSNVSVYWGSLKYSVPALPVADFPELQPGEFSHRFTMPGQAMRSMLESTARAMSKEETRYYLNGIYFHVHDATRWQWDDATQGMIAVGGNRAELRMVATDGHRLYRMDIEAPEGANGMPGIIWPRGTVELFLALTKGKACPETVSVEASDTKLRLSFGNIEITTKLVDGTFPDYQRVVPTGNDLVGTFDIGKLQAALSSVTVIASERGRAVKMTVESALCTMAVNNPDAGSATMELPCSLAKHGEASPFIEIGFNARYLETLLADLAEDGDEAVIEFGDAGSPTVFRSQRDGFMAVLMPMRV